METGWDNCKILCEHGLWYTFDKPTPTEREIVFRALPRKLDYRAVATKDGQTLSFEKALWFWGTELQALQMLNWWNRSGERPQPGPHTRWSYYAVSMS